MSFWYHICLVHPLSKRTSGRFSTLGSKKINALCLRIFTVCVWLGELHSDYVCLANNIPVSKSETYWATSGWTIRWALSWMSHRILCACAGTCSWLSWRNKMAEKLIIFHSAQSPEKNVAILLFSKLQIHVIFQFFRLQSELRFMGRGMPVHFVLGSRWMNQHS